MRKGGYLPELDGLRALSVGFVLLIHASYGRVQGGFLGVDIFFVISGYLITRIMMRERDATGRVDLRDFYRRRAFRILPPLIVCLVLAMLLWGGPDRDRLPVAASMLLFFANFMPTTMMRGLAHTWSLAIEEQFYIVWPLTFILASTRGPRAVAAVAVAVIVLSIATRAAMLAAGYAPVTLYIFTPARCDGLMIGCLLAVGEPWLSRRVARRALAPIAWCCLTGMVAGLFLVTSELMLETPIALTVFALLAAGPIFAAPRLADDSILRAALASPTARYIGRRSYGLYLYHYPIFYAAEAYRVPGNLANYAAVVVAEVALSLLVTEISWRLVERPIARARENRLRASA